MHADGTVWQEGDLWTNDRGVTFRLERYETPIGPVLVWVKQHYKCGHHSKRLSVRPAKALMFSAQHAETASAVRGNERNYL